MQEILHQLSAYITALDWMYIFTFIIFAYWINGRSTRQRIYKILGLTLRTRNRVALVGISYGIALYFLRGYSPGDAERLMASFVFALVFHKLILDQVLGFLKRRLTGIPDRRDKVLGEYYNRFKGPQK